MRKVTVAAIQMSCTDHVQANIQKAEKFVRQAVNEGAQIVLLQELFETYIFVKKKIRTIIIWQRL